MKSYYYEDNRKNLKIDPEIHHRIKAIVFFSDSTIKDVVHELLEKGIEQWEKDNEKTT